MLITQSLIKYTITDENSEKVVTYVTEGEANSTIELAKIVLEPAILNAKDRNLALIQLLVTPHVHVSLLQAILPFIEMIVPQLDSDQVKNNLNEWVEQTRNILNLED